MKAVIDADCIVAGTLTASGAAARLLDRWRDGEFELIACPRLRREVCEALLRPRIAHRYGLTDAEVQEIGARIEEEAIWVPDPVDPPRVVPDDPDDDYLVALALQVGADALVRRDHHFDGLEIPGVAILYPGEFLEQLGG